MSNPNTDAYQREIIRSMETGQLKKFVTAREERRDDLWSASFALQQEAATYKKQGDDLNWEVAIAVTELRKRPRTDNA